MNKKAIIIIPAYNEKDNIVPVMQALNPVINKIKGWDIKVMFVEGNSPDGTREEIKRLGEKDKKIILLPEKKKAGLGAAYLYAMDHAFNKLRADIVFEFDCDLSHDAKKIPDFFKKIDEGYDLVLGSRYIKGGGIPADWGIHRKFMSVFGNLVANIIMLDFSVRDWTTGYRALDKKTYESFKDKITDPASYAFQVQSLYFARRAGKKIAEVPFLFVDRKHGKSKMPGITNMASIFFFLFKAKVLEYVSPQFIKFAVVGFVGYLINASGLYLFANVLSFPEWLSWALSTEMSIISNFTLNNLWTFRKKQIQGVGKILKKFIHFNITSSGALLIMTTAGTIGVNIFGPQYRQLLLPFIIVFLVVPYNYFMYTTFIWKTKKSKLLGGIQKKL